MAPAVTPTWRSSTSSTRSTVRPFSYGRRSCSVTENSALGRGDLARASASASASRIGAAYLDLRAGGLRPAARPARAPRTPCCGQRRGHAAPAAVGLGATRAWRGVRRRARPQPGPARRRRPGRRRAALRRWDDAVPAIKKSLPVLQEGGATAWSSAWAASAGSPTRSSSPSPAPPSSPPSTKPDAMRRAEDSGAATVPAGPDQAAAIRELTGGRGVDAVFDFVGVTPTDALAWAASRCGAWSTSSASTAAG